MSNELIVFNPSRFEVQEQNIVVPVDFNIIELPLFSKNNKAKVNIGAQYIISARKNIKVDIIPVSGMSIPIDFDKKVYFALVQIAQEYKQKNNLVEIPNNIFTTFYEIYSKLDVQWKGGKTTVDSMFPVGGTKERIYQSLSKLAGTKYKLFNCFYDATIARKDENLYESTFIHSIRILKMENVVKDNHEALKFIKSQSHEIIQLQLNPFFLTNIINKKGHLRHSIADYNKLEDSTARDIYFWCEKNRKWLGVPEYGHDKRINVKVKKLAASIPLAFKGNNIPKTVYRVRQAFEFLLNNNLISDFIEHRSENSEPLSETWYEVGFSWSRDDKEYRITGREDFELEAINESKETIELQSHVIQVVDYNSNKILNKRNTQGDLFDKPIRVSVLPEIEKLIYKYRNKISNYTKEILNRCFLQRTENKLIFIKASIQYAEKYAKKNFDKYLQDTLLNEWALHLMEEASLKEAQIVKEKKKVKFKNELLQQTEKTKESRINEIRQKFNQLSIDERTATLAELIEKITKKRPEKLTDILKQQEDFIIAYWANKQGLVYKGNFQLILNNYLI